MNIIKGFALKRALVNNNPNEVAPVGELSSIGYTFSKEPRGYSNTVDPTISFIHFPSVDSDVGYEAPIPDAQRDQILRVIGVIYDKMLGSGTVVINPQDFANEVINQLGAAVTDVRVGLQVRSGSYYCIEWISWRNAQVALANTNRVWFSDAAFRGQHDEHEYTVVLPITPADNFFGHPDDVKAALTGLTYSEETERIQAARGESPETHLWGRTYNYVNPTNQNDKTPAKFTVLIYGASGINEDLIKEAIVQELLKDSTHTRDEWKNILPDLFRRTEFLIFPQWAPEAIENLTGTPGFYSPIVGLTEAMDKLVADSFEYEESHVRAHGQCFAFPFQSISLQCIGNVENRDDKYSVRDWFPDYFFTGITSFDFARMSEKTRDWVRHIHQLVTLAQTLTSSTVIPTGYSRATRGNKQFVARSFQDINWLVALRNQE